MGLTHSTCCFCFPYCSRKYFDQLSTPYHLVFSPCLSFLNSYKPVLLAQGQPFAGTGATLFAFLPCTGSYDHRPCVGLWLHPLSLIRRTTQSEQGRCPLIVCPIRGLLWLSNLKLVVYVLSILSSNTAVSHCRGCHVPRHVRPHHRFLLLKQVS